MQGQHLRAGLPAAPTCMTGQLSLNSAPAPSGSGLFAAQQSVKLCSAPGEARASPHCMDEIEKLDNVTWYGHCVIHVMAALNDLPDDAKLDFCQDLSKFIRRQQRALGK